MLIYRALKLFVLTFHRVYNCHHNSAWGTQFSNPFVESVNYIYNWLQNNPREIVFLHINKDGDGDGRIMTPIIADMLKYYFSGILLTVGLGYLN